MNGICSGYYLKLLLTRLNLSKVLGVVDAGASELVDEMATRIRAGDRTALGRAVTLVESTRPEDRRTASDLLERLLPYAGGLTGWGSPGCPGWASRR